MRVKLIQNNNNNNNTSMKDGQCAQGNSEAQCDDADDADDVDDACEFERQDRHLFSLFGTIQQGMVVPADDSDGDGDDVAGAFFDDRVF